MLERAASAPPTSSNYRQQLTAQDAWTSSSFSILVDLLPKDESNVFLRPVPPDMRKSLSFTELQRSAAATTKFIDSLGSGSRIASALRSTAELAALFFVVNLRSRLSFAPLNPELGEDEA